MPDAGNALHVRDAAAADLEAIRRIYNEGIEDRIATLDADPKDADDIAAWWAQHGERYRVLVAEAAGGTVLGWASLNPYSHRCAYNGVADLSVYVARAARGCGWSRTSCAARRSTSSPTRTTPRSSSPGRYSRRA